jgi:hypothetical protein
MRQHKKSSIARNDSPISALLTDWGAGTATAANRPGLGMKGAASPMGAEFEEMTEQKTPEKLQQMDTTSTKPAAPRRKSASLGRDVQAKIGQQLRAYYDGLIEPPPERFVELLQKLDKPAGERGSNE